MCTFMVWYRSRTSSSEITLLKTSRLLNDERFALSPDYVPRILIGEDPAVFGLDTLPVLFSSQLM